MTYDPFEDFRDKLNHDPTWKDFPDWLNAYRSKTNRFALPCAKCGAALTDADRDAGKCTQCNQPMHEAGGE